LPRQFDIVANLNSATRAQYPYLIVLQHDRLTSIRSVVSAPLVPWTSALEASRVHPAVIVRGRRFVVLVEELAAIWPTAFGETVGNAEANRYEIVAAIDLLFTGI
jgi:toxin CcdB